MNKMMIAIVLVGLLLGCNQSADVDQAAVPSQPEQAALAPELLAKLAAADKHDGLEDHVVGKCASCALMMDGKPEFQVNVAKYEMHFCSETCQKSYKNDAAGRLATLSIPESE